MSTIHQVKLSGSGRSIAYRLATAQGRPRALVCMVHGGGGSSKYFDIEGASALEFMAGCGYNAVAFDRPGYVANEDWLLGFDEQAKVLAECIARTDELHGVPGTKPFIYGHSIGGMLALLMANAHPDRYLGISMTGSGPVYHEQSVAMLTTRVKAALAEGLTHAAPRPGSQARYVGPAGTYDPAIAQTDPERDRPSLIADLNDALQWDKRLPGEAARATVPVRFVVPQHDELWRHDAMPGSEVVALFKQSPVCEYEVQRLSGHSVLVHHVARSHLYKTAAFIEECQVRERA